MRSRSDLAAKYDIAPWIQELSAKITLYIQQQRDFLYLDPRVAEDVSLLDYACGTGLVSRALGPYVGRIRALDLSANMVTRYKELSALSTIPSVKAATARTGNLLVDELEGLDLQGFSIAAICAALHHVADPASLITKLAGRLRAGGVLAVIDFVDEGEVKWLNDERDMENLTVAVSLDSLPNSCWTHNTQAWF